MINKLKEINWTRILVTITMVIAAVAVGTSFFIDDLVLSRNLSTDGIIFYLLAIAVAHNETLKELAEVQNLMVDWQSSQVELNKVILSRDSELKEELKEVFDEQSAKSDK